MLAILPVLLHELNQGKAETDGSSLSSAGSEPVVVQAAEHSGIDPPADPAEGDLVVIEILELVDLDTVPAEDDTAIVGVRGGRCEPTCIVAGSRKRVSRASIVTGLNRNARPRHGLSGLVARDFFPPSVRSGR